MGQEESRPMEEVPSPRFRNQPPPTYYAEPPPYYPEPPSVYRAPVQRNLVRVKFNQFKLKLGLVEESFPINAYTTIANLKNAIREETKPRMETFLYGELREKHKRENPMASGLQIQQLVAKDMATFFPWTPEIRSDELIITDLDGNFLSDYEYISPRTHLLVEPTPDSPWHKRNNLLI